MPSACLPGLLCSLVHLRKGLSLHQKKNHKKLQNTILQAGTGQILSQFFQSLNRYPEELATNICMSIKGRLF